MDPSGINELRMAAFAYYHNASQDLQKQARAFFDAMDINRDGRVSLYEFIKFIRERGYDSSIDDNVFRAFDRDGDGSLDFYEVLTLYYTIKTRGARCQLCGMWLTRLYFTCVTCFDSGGNAYDLCPACYAKHERRPQHGPNGHPNIFLDSYVLLRARRGQMPAAPPNMSLQGAIVQADAANIPAQTPAPTDLVEIFEALNLALTAANLITSCSIM